MPPPPKKAPNPEDAANRIFSVSEPGPFDAPLQFVRNEMPQKLKPFPLGDVTLNSGPLQQARDWNRGYIMQLPNDRLLHNFRVNAGLPSVAKPLGGWEAPAGELRGHFVGHYLSACALLYASTSDKVIKSKADELVAVLAACQAALNQNGYLSAFPPEFFDRLDRRENVWAPFYTMHKIMAGLLDMKIHAANDQALDVVSKMAGWVDAWTESKSEAHMQDILNTEYGGMNDVLYNLAAVTGDKPLGTHRGPLHQEDLFHSARPSPRRAQGAAHEYPRPPGHWSSSPLRAQLRLSFRRCEPLFL